MRARARAAVAAVLVQPRLVRTAGSTTLAGMTQRSPVRTTFSGLPRRNDYVQSAAPACNPQRPGTPAGAGRAYSSRWRRGPGLSYLLGRAGLTLASPYAAFRWPCEPASQWLWKLRSLRSDRCFLIGLRVCESPLLQCTDPGWPARQQQHTAKKNLAKWPEKVSFVRR